MILGKVARIISDKEVILNIGSVDGVAEDMEFVVYVEGDHIFDPETKEDLGPIETVKSRVTIVHVMERMSRAETSTYEIKIDDDFYDYERFETRHYRLDVESSDLEPLEEDYTVRIGDSVKSVNG
jgi:hypothetical protein